MTLDDLCEVAYANPGCGNAKIAAALVKRKKVLSIGVNRMRSHPLQKRFARNRHSIFLHAEIDAIKNALQKYTLKELQGATLMVARVKRDGTKALAAPCQGCQKAIEWFGIKDVQYTHN